MNNYLIATESLIGGRNENQDCFRFEETNYGLLAVVCDGMGGLNGGKVAAEIAVKVIFEQVSSSGGMTPRKTLIRAITEANNAIFSEGRKVPELKGMGTTVAALLINDNYALSFHTGDSRIYQFRGRKKIFRTFDHSLVFNLLSSGILTEEEARTSPQSNIITRALGIRRHIEVSVSVELAYKKGDRFLLCSDGIWGALPETELIKLVSHANALNTILNNLMAFIDQSGAEKGEKCDNMTGILIEMQNDSVMP